MNTMHFSQKVLSFLAFLMLLATATAQAKRVIERPYFLGSNNNKLEIERVTLDKKATILDVKIYQASGKVGIDSNAALIANGINYAYIGSQQLPKGVFVKVPECGYVTATLRFKPMPETTTAFDFQEIADNSVGIFTEYVLTVNDRRLTFRSTFYSRCLIKTANCHQPISILEKLL